MGDRFKEIVAEVEDLSNLCPKCKVPCQPTNLTEEEEIGKNAVIPMGYCEECDKFWIIWKSL